MQIHRLFRTLTAILVGGILVASSACSVDGLQQATAPSQTSEGGASTGTQLPVVSPDVTYSFALDPRLANTIVMGPNRLEIPADAICAVGSSSYGPTFWNSPCELETQTVTLTIVVSSTSDAGASIDFQPTLRFEPASNVVLTLSAPNVSVQDAKDWVILYCPSATSTTSGQGSGGSGGGKDGDKCVNESLTDKDLQTHIDYDREQLFRRIKHFSRYKVGRSGYTVAE